MSEKKSLTKKVEKGTDELADTLFSEKKSRHRATSSGTYKLEFIKQKVKTFCRKGLNLFEGPSTGAKGWFKLDV